MKDLAEEFEKELSEYADEFQKVKADEVGRVNNWRRN